jgi:manganese transport protein
MIPLWLRRVATMIPALVVVGIGVTPTDALVLSQVVLSLLLPVPMIALLRLCADRRVMGAFVVGPWLRRCAVAAAILVIGLNLVLLIQTAGLPVPCLDGPCGFPLRP